MNRLLNDFGHKLRLLEDISKIIEVSCDDENTLKTLANERNKLISEIDAIEKALIEEEKSNL